MYATRVLTAGFIGRVGFGIIPLALILRGSATGSQATVGFAAAAFAISAAVGGPARGRLVDRRPRHLLSLCAICSVTLVALGRVGSSWAALVLAIVAGLSAPPLVARTRMTVMTKFLAPGRPRLLAIDGALEELGFVIGPLAAAAYLYYFSVASLFVLVGATLLLSGALLSSRQGPGGRTGNSDYAMERPAEPRRSLPAGGILLFLAFNGCTAGALQIAFATNGRHRGPAEAGILFAAWSAGGVIGSLSTPWLTSKFRPLVLAGIAGALLSLACIAGVQASPDSGILLLAVIIGAVGAPLLLCAYLAEQDRESQALATTEKYSWMGLGNNAGLAIGNMTAGLNASVPWVPFCIAASAAAASATTGWTQSRSPKYDGAQQG